MAVAGLTQLVPGWLAKTWPGVSALIEVEADEEACKKAWLDAVASPDDLEPFLKDTLKTLYTLNEEATGAVAKVGEAVTQAKSVEDLITKLTRLDKAFSAVVSSLFQDGQLSIWFPDADGSFYCMWCGGSHLKEETVDKRVGGKKLWTGAFNAHHQCFKHAVDNGLADHHWYNLTMAQPLCLTLTKRQQGSGEEVNKRHAGYRNTMRKALMPLSYWKSFKKVVMGLVTLESTNGRRI